MPPALAGRFFTTSAAWEAPVEYEVGAQRFTKDLIVISTKT